MEKAKLKPCPFCNGYAKIQFCGRQYLDYWKGYINAVCQICRASTVGGYYAGEPIGIPLEDTIGAERAVLSWNMRGGDRYGN